MQEIVPQDLERLSVQEIAPHNTHHPIANEIRIQIMPSVDRPLVGTVKIVVCIPHHNGSIS